MTAASAADRREGARDNCFSPGGSADSFGDRKKNSADPALEACDPLSSDLFCLFGRSAA